MALVDNLLEYWTLDNTRNGTLGAINMSTTGTPAGFTSAIISDGLIFPGVSGRFNTFSYNTAVPAGTIAFWYKSTGDGTGSFHRVIAKTQVGVTDRIVIGFNNYGRRPSFNLSDTSIVLEGSDVSTRDVWYHHVITWNGTSIIWYINGVAAYTVSSSLTLLSNSTAFTVGGWSGNSTQQPAGVIDEMGFWLRALTSGEAAQLYNGGAGLTYPFTLDTIRPQFLGFAGL